MPSMRALEMPSSTAAITASKCSCRRLPSAVNVGMRLRFGRGDPGSEESAGGAWFVLEPVEVTELFFQRPGASNAAVGPGDAVDQVTFLVGEFVLACAQGPAAGFPVGGAHRCPAGAGGRFGVDTVQCSVDPLHDVERVEADGGFR